MAVDPTQLQEILWRRFMYPRGKKWRAAARRLVRLVSSSRALYEPSVKIPDDAIEIRPDMTKPQFRLACECGGAFVVFESKFGSHVMHTVPNCGRSILDGQGGGELLGPAFDSYGSLKQHGSCDCERKQHGGTRP